MHKHILQVSELTKKVRFILESELTNVWLSGEISNFIQAASGHWYLSLKDSKSQVKCAMFKGANRRVKLSAGAPKNGMQVLVRAKVSLYEPRGDFQLIIEHLESAGDGLLKQQYEQLKQQLSAQGLFNLGYKQPLPKAINHVGIVTSPTGAAVKDILTVLKRRNSHIKATIFPALVQGQLAQHEISAAISQANQFNINNPDDSCQVLIVGRGGGSLEDLWPFNEEQVVRAIFNSQIPVVSAVGHEIDTTLADLVADLRAPTPSAAAELVSSDISHELIKVQQLVTRLTRNTEQLIEQKSLRLKNLSHRLKQVHPEQQLQVQQQRADQLQQRLTQAINVKISHLNQKPALLQQRLTYLDPSKKLELMKQQLANANEALRSAIAKTQQIKTDRFRALIEQLHLVSPLATLARGYSISRNEGDQVITNAEQLKVGEQVKVQLHQGEFVGKVEQIIAQK